MDRVAVEVRNERTERFDVDFEPWAKTVVEITETYEQEEVLAVGGSCRSLMRSKLDSAGQLSSAVMTRIWL